MCEVQFNTRQKPLAAASSGSSKLFDDLEDLRLGEGVGDPPTFPRVGASLCCRSNVCFGACAGVLALTSRVVQLRAVVSPGLPGRR